MNDKNNRFNRKSIVTLITVNIFLLIFILLLVEFASRLIGFKTILEEESSQIKNNYKLFCKKYRKGGIIHENLYFTDSDGIFKYRPGQGINSDGFRSLEFKYLDTSVTKILLLGNSFTWGASAKPKKIALQIYYKVMAIIYIIQEYQLQTLYNTQKLERNTYPF